MQNLISLNLSPQDLADLDGAIATLRRVFTPMIALQPGERRELYKTGDKSEAFCRQTLAVLAANPQIIPPNLNLAEAQADLAALDQLRPRLTQLQQLLERAEDTATNGCHHDRKHGSYHCYRGGSALRTPASNFAPASARSLRLSGGHNDSTCYVNCSAARAAGAAPVRHGDPGYGRHFESGWGWGGVRVMNLTLLSDFCFRYDIAIPWCVCCTS